jgi:hypothetical protein
VSAIPPRSCLPLYGRVGTRQVGLDAVAQEQAVLQAARRMGPLRRADVVELCKIDPRQATRLLSRLVQRGELVLKGSKKSSTYEIAVKDMTAVNAATRSGQKSGHKPVISAAARRPTVIGTVVQGVSGDHLAELGLRGFSERFASFSSPCPHSRVVLLEFA